MSEYNNPRWLDAIDEIYKLKGINMITQQEHLDNTQPGKQIDREVLRSLRIINGSMALGVITWTVWALKSIVGWFL